MPYITHGFLRADSRNSMGFILLYGKKNVSRYGFRHSVLEATRRPVCHVILQRCAGRDMLDDAAAEAQLAEEGRFDDKDEKLKGIHGTYRGNLVVDEKLAQTGKGAGEKAKFLPDLMSPIAPGLPFFQTLEYYQRIVEALYSTVRLSKDPEAKTDENVGSNVCNMFHDMVLGHKLFFDNSHEIALQAAVCWLDRFASIAPDLERPFKNDVDRLRDAYNKDMDFLVYVQCYIRLFKRLRLPLKRNDKEQILLFGQLQGARQIAFFKLDQPTESLITIPYRTNSPAECRRELERLTHGGVLSLRCM